MGLGPGTGESRPSRVCVIGTPGVGKTWVASRLALSLGVPHVELDGFKLLPGRTLAPPEEVAEAIRATVHGRGWVLDGNWNDDELAGEVWAMADLLVWVDYPRWLVMSQVLVRSAWRVVTRSEYHGWRERPRDWLSPTHPLRWSWRMTGGYRRRYEQMLVRSGVARSVRLRHRGQAGQFIAQFRPT